MDRQKDKVGYRADGQFHKKIDDTFKERKKVNYNILLLKSFTSWIDIENKWVLWQGKNCRQFRWIICT